MLYTNKQEIKLENKKWKSYSYYVIPCIGDSDIYSTPFETKKECIEYLNICDDIESLIQTKSNSSYKEIKNSEYILIEKRTFEYRSRFEFVIEMNHTEGGFSRKQYEYKIKNLKRNI